MRKILKKSVIYFVFCVLIYITVIMVKNAFLPTYNSIGNTLAYDEDIYIKCNNRWSIIENDKVIAKGESKLDNKMDLLLFPNKIYSINSDIEKNFLWYEPFISEFGGRMYVNSRFIFPKFEEIEPNRILIGAYWSEINISSQIYAYSDKDEIVAIYNSIINGTFDYDYNNLDIELMESVFEHTPYFSLISEQVPGCAYSVLLKNENGRYYIYSEDNEIKYDITYLFYKIITEGTRIEKK